MAASDVAQLLLPFVGHFALVCVLLVALTVQRVGAVLAGEAQVNDYARANADGQRSRRVQRNLANQFELPMFAYFAAAVLIATQSVQIFDVIAAWIFLVGRIAHSSVQCLTDNVRLRGTVFLINFVGIALLMGHVAVLALAAVGVTP